MAKRKVHRITSGHEILYRRYIKGKPERVRSYRRALADLSLGEYLREIRERSEMTQQQLADAIGTQRTAISRLESADYDGHSIELLMRIADALHGRLVMRIETDRTGRDQPELVLTRE